MSTLAEQAAAEAGFGRRLLMVLAVCLALFHVYTGFTIPFTPMVQRGVHLGVTLAMVFIYAWRASKGRFGRSFYRLAAILAALAALYTLLGWEELTNRTTELLPLDYVVGILLIILVIEGTRLQIGVVMPLISIAFLAYAFLGPYLPGLLHSPKLSFMRIVSTIYIGTEGIFGVPLGVSATFAYLFILYTTLLSEFGGGEFLVKFAYSLFGTARGGPAKIAIVGSSLMGMISGSAVANVAGVGCITIPLMKHIGYRPEFAGGVEATASTGGQLMPPVMGTAAFIMAELLNIPYLRIAAAAAIPAVIYYATLFVTVDLEAVRVGLKGLSRSEMPDLKAVLREGWYHLISLAVLVVFLVVFESSPAKAATWSILILLAICLALALLKAERQREVRAFLAKVLSAAEKSAHSILLVAMCTACAGVIIGVFTATGLSLRLSDIMVTLAGGSLILLLIYTMIASLILGMGLTTTPAYLLLAVLAAPAMVKLGVPPLVAHMFVFYFGIMAPITPPVGLSFYVAAGIAKSDPMRTGFIAWRLALSGFLLPYLFVYNPEILGYGSVPAIILQSARALIIGVVLAAALEGFIYFARRPLHLLERVILLVAGIVIWLPTTDLVNLIALAVVAAVILASRFGRGAATGASLGPAGRDGA